MKKNIRDLSKKLSVDSNGKLSGGFFSVRGGRGLVVQLPNSGECANGVCDSQNTHICSNITCPTASNSGTKCTNTLSCII